MSNAISRRAVAAGLLAAPALAGAASAAVLTEPDPIFAAIESYSAAERVNLDLYGALDEAEGEVAERTGEHRPIALVQWRNYFIGGPEIDHRRDEWIAQFPMKRQRIEAEYRDAKRREQAKILAGPDWDRRHGMLPIRNEYELSSEQLNAAIERLCATTPTTVAGCAALVSFLIEDAEGSDVEWHADILEKIGGALASLAGGTHG